MLSRLRRLLRSSFYRNVGILIGGTTASQLVLVLASPILTRIFSPDEFGVLAIYAAVLGVLGAIATLQYDVAIPLPGERNQGLHLLVLAWLSVGASTTVIALIVLVWGDDLVTLAGVPFSHSQLWLIPLGMLMMGCYQAITQWAIRQQAFREIARTKFTQAFSSIVSQMLLGVLGVSSSGLMIGHIFGQSAGVRSIANTTISLNDIRQVSSEELRKLAARYRNFPLIGAPSVLLNSLGLQLPAILIGALYGVGPAGWYSLSRRILGAPMQLIGRSVGQVYLSEAARVARQSIPKLRALYLKTALRLLLFAALPVLVLAVFGPPIFALVFGVEWREAGAYTQLLSVMLVTQAVVSPLSQTFVILEAQKYTLVLNIIKVIIVMAAFLVPHYLGLSDRAAIMTFSLSLSGYYMLSFATVLYVMRVRELSDDIR